MQTQEAVARGLPRLADRVAIVTGAGSGIGAAIVRRFVDEGAFVVAADIKAESLGRYAGADAIAPLAADVSRSADAERMVKVALDRFGKLDIVVNNAGIVDAFLPVGEVTDQVWDRVLAVNLTGPMMVSRAAIKVMLPAGGGAVVNIASVGGLVGGRAGAAYTASKHGLIGLTRNIAATYLKDRIRCNAICPGGVDTGIALGGEPSKRGYEALSRTLATNPRTAKPEEIAAVAAFLASDEASFVNGAVVVADGGWTAA
jgi:NAD(P)-dependent dehydrogenase (short-subunit alcohol dehydrogenase family)